MKHEFLMGPMLRYGTKLLYALGYFALDLDDHYSLAACDYPLFSTPVDVPIAQLMVQMVEVI